MDTLPTTARNMLKSKAKKRKEEMTSGEQSERVQEHPDPEDLEITILLVGKTGTGKSSAGNTIIQPSRSQFGENPLVCEKKVRSQHDCRELGVIDTPGLFPSRLTAVEMKRQVATCVSMCAPGPHVFLIVIDPKRFSREDQDLLEIIKKMFGEEAVRYTMVLFTHRDQMERDGVSGERFLYFNPSFNELLSKCQGGYHVFKNHENNRDANDRQVDELVEKIDSMVQRNGGRRYTNTMFREAQRAVRRELAQYQDPGPEERRSTEINNSFIRAVEQAAAAAAAVGVAEVLEGVRATREDQCLTQ